MLASGLLTSANGKKEYQVIENEIEKCCLVTTPLYNTPMPFKSDLAHSLASKKPINLLAGPLRWIRYNQSTIQTIYIVTLKLYQCPGRVYNEQRTTLHRFYVHTHTYIRTNKKSLPRMILTGLFCASYKMLKPVIERESSYTYIIQIFPTNIHILGYFRHTKNQPFTVGLLQNPFKNAHDLLEYSTLNPIISYTYIISLFRSDLQLFPYTHTHSIRPHGGPNRLQRAVPVWLLQKII